MWINDSQRFLLEHFDIIHNSPSQLYHSALPFCPSSSWLCQCYSLELSQEVKIVKGLPAEWGMCSRTVQLNDIPRSISYWDNTVAVGSDNKDILILDTITGSQTAVLSGHTDKVESVTFSSDGTSLVSGSEDKTVKLWDVQTGGVVRTFHGHTGGVVSVAISADHTTIASGSYDKTLRLWNIQKGECHQIIEHEQRVYCVRFSPTNPQCLISVCSFSTVQQWNIDGHKVGPTYDSYHAAFSPDGTQFILCRWDNVTIHNINSGLVVTKFHLPNIDGNTVLCFSPDHKLVAIVDSRNIHVWDITGSDPYLVETFISSSASSLAFSSPSTLISASYDKSVRFWQIGASSTGVIVTAPRPTPLTLAPTRSTALKPKNELIIPSDLPDGVIKTWGILTGLHKGSLQIPAQDSHQSNTQLTNNKLIFVWCADEKINIWDVQKGEPLWTINVPRGDVKVLRVSGDGTKVFCVYEKFIQAWDIRTGEVVGKVEAQDADVNYKNGTRPGEEMRFCGIEGSKIWAYVSANLWSSTRAWDFGIPGSPPVLFSRDKDPPERLHLNDNKVWEIKMFRMKDIVTGKVVVQLPERLGKAYHVQWDGHYLVVSFKSGEVVILDFSCVSL